MAFDEIPGLDAQPGFGLMIGATILSCSLIWIVKGLKNGSLVNVLIGTFAIGIEAVILLRPNYFSADFAVIFVVSLICALCIGGLIAGSTKDHTETLPNYA